MKSPSYTAVVYVHGIGRQLRHEGLSQLLGALDAYASGELRSETGSLRQFTPVTELISDDLLATRTYVSFHHYVIKGHRPRHHNSFRAYDVYWSNITAGGLPLIGGLFWFFWHAIEPTFSIFDSLRRAGKAKMQFLLRLMDTDKGKWPQHDYAWLMSKYADFQTREKARKYHGSFGAFHKFASDGLSGDGARHRILKLARHWKRSWYLRRTQAVWRIVALMTIPATAILFVAAIIIALDNPDKIQHTPFASTYPYLPLVLMLTVPLVAAVIWHVFTYLVADIRAWTAYQERDALNPRRSEILRAAVTLFHDLANDKNCKRIVIIAHSLGTAIAYDALRHLGRLADDGPTANEGLAKAMEKITDFITMGSPIDRLSFFFGHHQSRHYRYNRIMEHLDRDIGRLPFARPSSSVRWANFWDRSDIISSSLYSPQHTAPDGGRINRGLLLNIEVWNTVIPSAASHVTYFSNRSVVDYIFQCIFFNEIGSPPNRQSIPWSLKLIRNVVGFNNRILLALAFLFSFLLVLGAYFISLVPGICFVLLLSAQYGIGAGLFSMSPERAVPLFETFDRACEWLLKVPYILLEAARRLFRK